MTGKEKNCRILVLGEPGTLIADAQGMKQDGSFDAVIIWSAERTIEGAVRHLDRHRDVDLVCIMNRFVEENDGTTALDMVAQAMKRHPNRPWVILGRNPVETPMRDAARVFIDAGIQPQQYYLAYILTRRLRHIPTALSA